MKISQLNVEQLEQVKVHYWTEKNGENISYGEIANIDNLVSNEEIFEAYGHMDFTEDDFSN